MKCLRYGTDLVVKFVDAGFRVLVSLDSGAGHLK
jgi:hypothetical protein